MGFEIVDNELKVMQNILELLRGLTQDERVRVVNWFSDRFGSANFDSNEFKNYLLKHKDVGGVVEASRSGEDRLHVSRHNMQSEVDLLSRLKRKEVMTDGDKVWEVLKWLKATNGQLEVSAYEVNQELKKLGMRVQNITSAFSSLVKRGVVVQVDKKGRYKQGRKKYRLVNIK